MKKVFLFIFFSIIQNFISGAQASLFDMLPRELTHKILADYPLSFQLQCRLINQNFLQKSEFILYERMNHAWDWSEQIPRMFYEHFSEYNKNLEDPFQPQFIKELCKTKLEIALPFFCFHNFFDKKYIQTSKFFDIKIQENTLDKNIGGEPRNIGLRWNKNQKDIVEKNIIQITTSTACLNFLNSLGHYQSKNIILILNIDDNQDNWNKILTALNQEKICKKIHVLQIQNEIDETVFPYLSQSLKELGNKLTLSVAPLTRVFCIHDEINIVLPREYKNNENLYKELIQELYSSKRKKNYASIWLEENIDHLRLSCHENFSEDYGILAHFIFVIGIGDHQNKDIIKLFCKNLEHRFIYEMVYDTKNFKSKLLKSYIELLKEKWKNQQKYEKKFTFNCLKAVAIHVADDNALAKLTLLCLHNKDMSSRVITILEHIKSPMIIKNILPQVLHLLNDQNRECRESLFSSNFCVQLYEYAAEIFDLIGINNFNKFQRKLIKNMLVKDKDYLRTSLCTTRFKKSFLSVMDKNLKHQLLNHKIIGKIFCCFEHCKFIISFKDSMKWLELMDNVAQNNNITEENIDNVFYYITQYISLQISSDSSCMDIVSKINKELTSKNYSEQLKTAIYFTVCKNRKKWNIREDFIEIIIKKTGIFAHDLLVNWICDFTNEENNEKHNINIIKILIDMIKDLPQKYEYRYGLLEAYMDVFCNLNIIEQLTPDEQALLNRIILSSCFINANFYYDFIKILKHSTKNEDKKIDFLNVYYQMNKGNIMLNSLTIAYSSQTRKHCVFNEKNQFILKSILKESYERYIEKEISEKKLQFGKNITEIKRWRDGKSIFSLQDLIDILLNKYLDYIVLTQASIKNLKNIPPHEEHKNIITFSDSMKEIFQCLEKTDELCNFIVNKLLAFYKQDNSFNSLSDLIFIISSLCSWTMIPIEKVIEELSQRCMELLEKTGDCFEVYKAIQHINSIKDQEKFPIIAQLFNKCIEKYITCEYNWFWNSSCLINPYIIKLLEIANKDENHRKAIENIIEKISERNYIKNFIQQVPNLKKDMLSICKNLCKLTKEFSLLKPLAKTFCQELNSLKNIFALYRFTDDKEIENICKRKLYKFGMIPTSGLIILLCYCLSQKYRFLNHSHVEK